MSSDSTNTPSSTSVKQMDTCQQAPLQQSSASSNAQGTPSVTNKQLSDTSISGDGKTKEKESVNKSYWYPDRNSDMHEVTLGYRKRAGRRWLYLSWIPVALLAIYFFRINPITDAIYSTFQEVHKEDYLRDSAVLGVVLFSCSCVAFIFLVLMYWVLSKGPVYLVDFATFHPPDELKCPPESFHSHSIQSGYFTEDSITFQSKLLAQSGLGNETYFPAGILKIPPDISMQRAREECEMVFTGCIDELLAKTHLTPQDIDILIVNCSLFNPTPSISSMIINKYKMRTNIKSYNLSGMGCSAGIISVDLAKEESN